MAAVIAGMTMVAGCYATPTNSVAATNPPDASLLTYQPAPDLEQLPTTNAVAAPEPATVVPSAEKATLPTNFTPSPQLAEVIKLVQAGIDGPVLTSYITNATAPFDISAEAIIYLNDLGVPNETILTMMQRDYALGYTVVRNPPPAALPATMPDTNAIADVTTTAPDVAGGPAVPDEPAIVIEEPAPVASVTDFYDTLSPYGTWVDIEGYGRCWQPTIVVSEPAWQPYCDRGHWVYSDCGWYWASDYSWGLTFHYGRWFRHSRWGWCWVPDTTWGPSWVSWRNSTDYCGWAPLPPFTTFVPGIGFSYYGRNVGFGFGFNLTPDCYTFVSCHHFYDRHPRHWAVARPQVRQIYTQTTVVNNFSRDSRDRIINRGVDRERIAMVSHTPVHTVPVREPRGASRHVGDRNAAWSNNQMVADARPIVRPPSVTITPGVSSSRFTENWNGRNQRMQPRSPAASTRNYPVTSRENRGGQTPSRTMPRQEPQQQTANVPTPTPRAPLWNSTTHTYSQSRANYNSTGNRPMTRQPLANRPTTIGPMTITPRVSTPQVSIPRPSITAPIERAPQRSQYQAPTRVEPRPSYTPPPRQEYHAPAPTPRPQNNSPAPRTSIGPSNNTRSTANRGHGR